MFKETIRLKPNFILGYRKIAFIYELKRENEKVIQTLEKILKLQPHDETAILKLSEIRRAKGDNNQADLLEIQTKYEEVQTRLNKYKDLP